MRRQLDLRPFHPHLNRNPHVDRNLGAAAALHAPAEWQGPCVPSARSVARCLGVALLLGIGCHPCVCYVISTEPHTGEHKAVPLHCAAA